MAEFGVGQQADRGVVGGVGGAWWVEKDDDGRWAAWRRGSSCKQAGRAGSQMPDELWASQVAVTVLGTGTARGRGGQLGRGCTWMYRLMVDGVAVLLVAERETCRHTVMVAHSGLY